MTWKERISRILALGMYDWMCDTNCSYRTYELEHDLMEIAYDAGIEAEGLKCATASCQIDYFRACVWDKKWLSHIKERPIFYIAGSGLSCEDLDGHSFAVGTKIEDVDTIKENDFIVLKTDQNYYDECTCYDYIVRQAVMPIEVEQTVDEIIKAAKRMDDQCMIYLKKYENGLRKQFDKSKTLYPDKRLILVRWFKDGLLRWEFHPIENVKYKIRKI